MLLKLSKFFLYASFFSVLIVITTTFFPFIGGKYYFYRTATELALLCFVLWWGFQAKPGAAKELFLKVTKQPLFIAVSAFVAAFMLATLFAYDVHAAFWSNFERGDGGFQMVHYYISFVLMLMLFKDAADWERLLKVSLVAAISMILYGVLGQFNTIPSFISPYGGSGGPPTLWGKLTSGRFQGSLGNPAYVAPYLLFSMFYSLYLWVSRPTTKRTAPGGSWDPEDLYAYIGLTLVFAWFAYMVFANFFVPASSGVSSFHPTTIGMIAFVAICSMAYLLYLWFRPATPAWIGKFYLRHIFYGGLTFIFLFFFAVSQTRGAFVGLVAAMLVFFGYLIFTWPRGRRAASLALIGIIVVLGIFFYYRDTKFVKELPGGRFFSVSLSDQTIQTRAWTWNSAWQGFKERPLFGWGPENFTAVFDKHFDTRHYVPGTDSETWFDRAHSVIFDYLAETGIIGLVAYLGMFAVFYREFLKKIVFGKRSESGGGEFSPNRFEQALLVALPAGYLVQGLALFDVLPIYINLFLFLAFATYLFSKGRATNESGIS